MASPTSPLAIILGGGRGSRLYPLTRDRCKPAVPIGGKYRLIDIPISNCLHSGVRQIYVLTQFLSASLHRHIARAYRLDDLTGGFVDILAAEQGATNLDWYQGTADAVRKQIDSFDRPTNDPILILSGDHLYKMDYREMVATHERQRADITLGVIPTGRRAAPSLGILQVNGEGMIVRFVEKPAAAPLLDDLATPPATLARLGGHDPERPFLASMGIYCFRREILSDLLRTGTGIDFGRDLIPAAIQSHRVAAHYFDGYWEDVGTIDAYYRSQLMLSESPHPAFLFHGSNETRIYSRGRYLPASRCMGATLDHATLADGCVIHDRCTIRHSLLGLRTIVRPGSRIEDSILNGADHYADQTAADNPAVGPPHIGIGRECTIVRAILDKNVRIGDRVTLTGAAGRPDEDGDGYFVRDGIVIIPKNGVIAAGRTI